IGPAAGLLTQFPGVLLAVLLPCFLVGLEFQERTFTAAAVLSGSRLRVLGAKLVVIGMLLAGALLATTAGVAVSNAVFGPRLAPHVIPGTPFLRVVPSIVRVMFVASLVQALVAAAAMFITVARKSIAGALVTAVAVLAVDAVLA